MQRKDLMAMSPVQVCDMSKYQGSPEVRDDGEQKGMERRTSEGEQDGEE